KEAEAHDVWYVGGVTDENAREVKVKLDFLQPGATYDAIIYSDAKDASGLPGDAYNPQAYTITKKKVTCRSTLTLRMAPCGGFAVSIRAR
ncbi:MAG: glycoside hydrolase family 97 C-terminal domain-containing protein, partial [Bacteroidales bacterium]|nr:glycoside hydrolase family 97 C-terminal domain-containing protein [Bacteroidales bacterium]